MTFNEITAVKVRNLMEKAPGLSERRVFGGVAFMVGGNMCCGVIEDHLVVRVGPKSYENALREPHTRPMDLTGRPLAGFVSVAPEGFDTQDALLKWIDRGLDFVRTLPVK
jgi:TfoX/Sxy family transcriptional regulator of competence genes